MTEDAHTTRVNPPADWLDDPSRPPVVIAIPHWNRCDLLEDCVDSLLGLTAYPRYRICVFDQGSTDGSSGRLAAWGSRVDAILAPDNVGFIVANNIMMERYAGWDVLLLNNDTRVETEEWLDVLVATAYSARDIGLVGAKLVYPDGQLQEAGSQLFQNGSARAYGKFEPPDASAFNNRRDVDFCSAACLYVKREVLVTCGGFDEAYKPCYYEDVDLALKARAAGYRTVYEPRARVVHKEYGTSGRVSATELMTRNRETLIARWHDLLTDRPVSLWQLPREDAREQVLVLAATTRSSEGAAELMQLLGALAGDYQVAYAHLESGTANERLQPPGRWNVTVFYPGYARGVGSHLLDLGAVLLHNRFRWVLFDTPETAATWGSVARNFGGNAQLITDVAALRPFRPGLLQHPATGAA